MNRFKKTKKIIPNPSVVLIMQPCDALYSKLHRQENPALAILPFSRCFLPQALQALFATNGLVGSWTSGELNQFANDLMPA